MKKEYIAPCTDTLLLKPVLPLAASTFSKNEDRQDISIDANEEADEFTSRRRRRRSQWDDEDDDF